MTNTQRKQLADLVKGRTGTDAEIAAAIATESVALVSRFITKTSIYAAIGFSAGVQLAGALEAMSKSSDPATALQGREILALLDPTGNGIDVALPEVRGVIDTLTAAGVMSADVAATIKGLGERRSLSFTPNAADVAEAKELNARIAAQEQVHRDFSQRLAPADEVLAQLNSGRLVDVVEEL
jgi:hypothetical protein